MAGYVCYIDKQYKHQQVKKTRPLITIWVLLALLMSAGLLMFYQYQSQIIKKDTGQLLQSVSQTKIGHIESWLAERRNDLRTFTEHPNFISNFSRLKTNQDQRQRITERLQAFVKINNYGRMTLVNHQGEILVDVGNFDEHMPSHTIRLIQQAETQKAFQSQLFWEEGVFHYDIVAPVVDYSEAPPVFKGAIVMHVDPTDFLIPFIASWPMPSETAKTELLYPFEKSYVILAPLKGENGYHFEKIAVHGEDEFDSLFEGHEHNEDVSLVEEVKENEQSVYLHHQNFESVNWSILSTIHKSEVFKNLYQMLIWGGLIGFISLLLVGYAFVRVLTSEQARLKAEQLEASQQYFMGLFMNAPTAYQSLDENGLILDVNEAWCELFGYQREEVLNQPYSDYIRADSIPVLQVNFPDLIKSGHVENVPFTIVRKDASERSVLLQGRISGNQNSGDLRTHCTLTDVTEKLRSEKALRLAAKVFDHTGEGLMVTKANRQIVSVNEAFTGILGYSEQELIGKTPKVLQSGQHDQTFYEEMWDDINQNGIWQGEIWNRHKDGHLIPEWLTITEMKNDDGQVENYIGVFADISKLKASQAELDFLAHHDVLTVLPNRRRFMTNLEYAIAHAKRDNHSFGVLMLDLDRFKEVNDGYGHAAGDEVLKNTAELLKQQVREVDMVARLGGDEFVILIENLTTEDDAARIARNVIAAISEPQSLNNQKLVSVGCSIGITLYPEHGENPEVLMQHADSALYLAKQKGRGTFEYFSPEMTEHAQQRMSIESELKSALRHGELRVFYQPQIDLKTGKVKGAEALVRWQHPKLGLMAPSYFIGVAEESELIAKIGEWVLNETCRQAKVWHDQGNASFVYAVNVSPKQMAYTDLFSVVMQALKNSGLPAEQLELEITESGLMSVGKGAVNLFEKLRGLGIRIAIDDFGTGYSSLSYLKSLPLDVLKVDKQFVDDIPSDEQGMQIVNTIIAMAHSLRLDVLAEGVEEEVQKNFLELKGCNYYQGYLTSPPVSAEEFEAKFLN